MVDTSDSLNVSHRAAKTFRRRLHRMIRAPGATFFCAIAVGLLTLIIGFEISRITPVVPEVHDEFSYLLAADTYAQGRLANPPHPMWKHFESVHIIQQPTYASKFPPTQGLLLATGIWLSGSPVAGLWLSSGLAAMAIVWMLAGFLPTRWALLGGLLFALHANIQLQWGQTFWGGNGAVIGGALLYGAMVRLLRRPSIFSTVILVLGLAVLALGRPYQGFMAALPVALVLAANWFGKNRPPLAIFLRRVVLPGVPLLILLIGAIAMINVQVTGDPLKMPYQLHEETYGYSPIFAWNTPREKPVYNHQQLRNFHLGWETSWYQRQQTLADALQFKSQLTMESWRFFLGPILTIPLLAIPWMLSTWKGKFAIGTLLWVLATSLVITWMQPHYLAPVVPLLFLLIVQGIRYVRTLGTINLPVGRFVTTGVLILFLLGSARLTLEHLQQEPNQWQHLRHTIAGQLEQTPGEHLVIVSYPDSHNGVQEWVYNRADIDAAKVVWARSMKPAENRRLVNYFQGRRVWRLFVDPKQPRLVEQVGDSLRK